MAAFMRATVFVVFAGWLVFAVVQRRVLAQLDEAMLELGSRVMLFPAGPSRETRTLEINGVDIRFRVQSASAPVEDVIRHYRGVCATRVAGPGTYGPLIASLATRSRSNDVEGYVACVDIDATNFTDLVRRLAKFSKTWDVADAGLPRYVYARRASRDPESRTLLFTLWADGSLRLRDLLPLEARDAKGTDPAGVPRLPRSRRILSARESGAPSEVYLYTTPRAPTADITAFYRRELTTRGWTFTERKPGEATHVAGTRLLAAEKAGRAIALLVRPSKLEQMLVVVLVTEAG